MGQVKRANPHDFSEIMSKKSITATLPIMDANEAKHEDCLKIMDGYEKILTDLFIEAHGKILKWSRTNSSLKLTFAYFYRQLMYIFPLIVLLDMLSATFWY